jgi:hypothetical protein
MRRLILLLALALLAILIIQWLPDLRRYLEMRRM